MKINCLVLIHNCINHIKDLSNQSLFLYNHKTRFYHKGKQKREDQNADLLLNGRRRNLYTPRYLFIPTQLLKVALR
jgi:hypothetical protein